jgi:hypothetical protein
MSSDLAKTIQLFLVDYSPARGCIKHKWCVCVLVVRLCSCGVCGAFVFMWCICIKRLRKCLAVKGLGAHGRARALSP